jgi:hypothetical protein
VGGRRDGNEDRVRGKMVRKMRKTREIREEGGGDNQATHQNAKIDKRSEFSDDEKHKYCTGGTRRYAGSRFAKFRGNLNFGRFYQNGIFSLKVDYKI